MVIAYTLYKGVVLEEVELDRSEVNYIIFVCGVPIIAEFLPFTTESYGYAEGWCWIKIQNIQSDLDGSSTYNYGTF